MYRVHVPIPQNEKNHYVLHAYTNTKFKNLEKKEKMQKCKIE